MNNNEIGNIAVGIMALSQLGSLEIASPLTEAEKEAAEKLYEYLKTKELNPKASQRSKKPSISNLQNP